MSIHRNTIFSLENSTRRFLSLSSLFQCILTQACPRLEEIVETRSPADIKMAPSAVQWDIRRSIVISLDDENDELNHFVQF
ncbi:unnamed protein product [Mucor fragilis]